MRIVRNIGILFLIFVFVTASLCACNKADVFKTERLHVVCTVYPVYELTREVCGDKAEIMLLAKPGVEPHEWEPGSDDMLMLEQADLLIACGAGMEPWLDPCLKAIDNKDLKVCYASENVDLIKSGDGHGEGTDPHYWLSLKNAGIAAEEIRDCLCEADKDNSDAYKANAQQLLSDISALEEEFTSKLSGHEGREIVVSHEAFTYLCRDLGLEQLAIDGMSEDSEPDAGTIAEIIDRIKKDDVKVIFYDPLESSSASETIKSETGVELMELHTFETVSNEEFEKNVTYCEIMRMNLDSLDAGFGKE